MLLESAEARTKIHPFERISQHEINLKKPFTETQTRKAVSYNQHHLISRDYKINHMYMSNLKYSNQLVRVQLSFAQAQYGNMLPHSWTYQYQEVYPQSSRVKPLEQNLKIQILLNILNFM